jgi:hypothetical protein
MRTATFLAQTVTTKDVLDALVEFHRQFPKTNDYENWMKKRSYRHAIHHIGNLYPPKRILSGASGNETRDFSGGKQTNDVLKQLGFNIIKKP